MLEKRKMVGQNLYYNKTGEKMSQRAKPSDRRGFGLEEKPTLFVAVGSCNKP